MVAAVAPEEGWRCATCSLVSPAGRPHCDNCGAPSPCTATERKGQGDANAVRVNFRRCVATAFGDSVVISGSEDWLGAWDLALAVPCTCEADSTSPVWRASVAVPQLGGAAPSSPPKGGWPFEYKYVIQRKDGSCVWEAGPNRSENLMFDSGRGGSMDIDDTRTAVHFRIQKSVPFGRCLAVCGSPPALGGWDPGSAPRLEWREHDVWETRVTLPSSFLEEAFAYKFVVGATSDRGGPDPGGACPVWEARGDREVRLGDVEPLGDGARELWGAWDATLVRLSLYFPLRPGQTMGVCGGHEELGAWQCPRRMALGPRERTLRTGARGRCWEFAFPASGAARRRVEYRYVILPQEEGSPGSAIWEREPNRTLDLPGVAGARSGALDVHDVNFVGGMQFDFVPPCLFVGPYPQTTEHIDSLIEAGVGGVLNTQTVDDFRQRQIDGKVLWDHYHHHQIDARHFPIKDFDGDDLARRLMAGAGQVHEMVCEGKKVFIHCTAGMGRAPAVAVVYLCRYQGLTFEEAYARVRAHRKVAAPNVGAMRSALGI